MLHLLDYYRPTPLKSAIDQFYQRKIIFHPSDIDLAFFAEYFGAAEPLNQ